MTVFEFYRVALDAHHGAAEIGGDLFEHEIVNCLDNGKLNLRCPAIEIGQHIGAVPVVVIDHLPRLTTTVAIHPVPRGWHR